MELHFLNLVGDKGIIDIPKFDPTTLVLVTFAGVLLFEILIYIILFRKPRIDEAIVRTGAGGAKSVVNNGIFVLPLFHRYKVISLCQHTLVFKFNSDSKIYWASNQIFQGEILVTLKVPSDNQTMLVSAARNLSRTHCTNEIQKIIEPAFKSSIREHFKSYKYETFSYEPSTIEVRLTRSLDLVAFAFGLKIQAVHIQETKIY